MVEVDSKKLVDSFSESYYEIVNKYDEIRYALDNVSLDSDRDSKILDERGQFNEIMGDYMETLFTVLSKTDVPKYWVKRDNQTYITKGVDSLYGLNDSMESSKKILESGIFENYEDGLSARVAHFSNMSCHVIEKYGLLDYCDRLGINSNNIRSIRSSRNTKYGKNGEKYNLEAIKYADLKLTENASIEEIDEAIANPKKEENKEIIDKIHETMKECGMNSFSTNSTKDFIKLIKCNKLNKMLLSMKSIGLEGMLYNLNTKGKLAQHELDKDEDADLTDYEPELLFGYVKEDSNSWSIKGKNVVRLVIKGEEDRGSMQFHLTQNEVNELMEKYDIVIPEDERLTNAISLAIPYPIERNRKKIEEVKKYEDSNIESKLKEFDGGIFEIIAGKFENYTKCFKRLFKYNKESREQNSEWERG